MPETTKTCQVKMHDGKPCGRELYDNQHCIFHSTKENKDVTLFQEGLDQIFKDERFTTYDCTRFIFPEGVVFPKSFSKPVMFECAIFGNKADFRRALFKGSAIFISATFKGRPNFKRATFKGTAHFRGATFTTGANFVAVTFENEAFFESTLFEHDTYFLLACFRGKAKFQGTRFKRTVNFRDSTFKGAANFSFSAFKSDAYFWQACFEDYAHFTGAFFIGYVSFGGAIFKGNANFGSCVFATYAVFTAATFEEGLILIQPEKDPKKLLPLELDFRWVTLSKPEKVEFRKADLGRFRFLGTDVRKVDFTDVKWYRQKDKGRNRAFDEVSPAPDPKNPDIKKFDYELIGKLYRQLRANYEENLRYSEAGDFYIGEMEMTRKAERNIFKKLPLLFYKAISNYGESYYRPLGWILTIFIIFPMLFMIAGIQPINLDSATPTQDVINYKWDLNSIKSILPDIQKLADYRTSFLYAMSVFSLVRDKKYTTINKSGYALFLAESILTPVFLAFFLLALRRRFKR